MPIEYKINILEALKESGCTTYKIKKEKLFSESTVQAFRTKKLVTLDNIERVCKLLNCQPGDLLEYIPEK